jgi:hypothetical protein
MTSWCEGKPLPRRRAWSLRDVRAIFDAHYLRAERAIRKLESGTNFPN